MASISAPTISQKAADAKASPAVQLSSSGWVRGAWGASPSVRAAAGAGGGRSSPSGSKPMSSGRRRMMRKQGDCQQQGEYAQHPIGYSPTGEGGYCGDYLYVDAAAHGPEGGYEAYGQAAAPVEEVDGDGAWHDAYEGRGWLWRVRRCRRRRSARLGLCRRAR